MFTLVWLWVGWGAWGGTLKLALAVSVTQVPHPGCSPAAQASGIWRNGRPGTLIPFKDSFKEIRRVRSILLYFSPRLFLSNTRARKARFCTFASPFTSLPFFWFWAQPHLGPHMLCDKISVKEGTTNISAQFESAAPSALPGETLRQAKSPASVSCYPEKPECGRGSVVTASTPLCSTAVT